MHVSVLDLFTIITPYVSALSCSLLFFFVLMIRRPPRSTRTDTLYPYPTLFRSKARALPEILSATQPEAFKSIELPMKVARCQFRPRRCGWRCRREGEIGRAHV